MQPVSSRIWTRVAVFISYDDNHYTTGTNNNHIKAKIDKMQLNRKSRLCIDKHETITNIVSECSKLAQKDYITRNDWGGMMINSEWSKRIKLGLTIKR